MIRAALLLLLATAAPAAAQTAEEVLAEAKADCASFDNGTFTAPAEAVTELELTGAPPAEILIDTGKFQCSSMADLWGGTGGSILTLLAGGQRSDHLALGWKVVDWDRPVLLLSLHGGECGAAGSDPCIEALVWGGNGFLSIRAPAVQEGAAPAEATPPKEPAPEGN